MGYVPAGVVGKLVLMVSELAHVLLGLQGLLVKVAVAPAGRPDVTESVIGCVVPLVRVRVMVLVLPEPCTAVILPPLVRL